MSSANCFILIFFPPYFHIANPSWLEAPEILRPEPYTHSVDWWSLGILFFALLQGKVKSFPLTQNFSVLSFANFTFKYPPAIWVGFCVISLTFLIYREITRRIFIQHKVELGNPSCVGRGYYIYFTSDLCLLFASLKKNAKDFQRLV